MDRISEILASKLTEDEANALKGEKCGSLPIDSLGLEVLQSLTNLRLAEVSRTNTHLNLTGLGKRVVTLIRQT